MTAASPDVTRWLDAFFAAGFRRRPVDATFVGVHDFDDALPDYSEEGAADTVAGMQDLLARAEQLALADAPLEQRIDVRLARGFLKLQRREFDSLHFHRGNPSLYSGEAVFGAMSLLLTDFAPLPERVASAVARLRAVPAFLAQARANIRHAPAAWTERAIRECRGALAFLGDGIRETGAGAGTELERAAAAAADAFVEYRDWLMRELRGRTHEEYGCGAALFELYLHEGHGLAEDANSIAAAAETELEAARRELEEGARRLGAGSPAEALARLGNAHPSTDRYLERYREIWEEARAFAVERGLLTWPDFPIRFVPRPVWARAAAPDLYFLFYRSPAAFRRPAVHDYFVTPVDTTLPRAEQLERLRATNDSVIRLNHVIHHGGIGHHVQNWHAFRAPSRIGRVAAVDCASRIAMFCGGTMAEGWACYATDLMSEAGFLSPLERLAEWQARMRLCSRAIVDVGLHTAGWTLERAARFYESQAGMTSAAARAEAVKNSMFPGTALMYFAGSEAIHRLRRELVARAGGRFDLRGFHDTFLSFGSIPVAIIAEEMRRPAARETDVPGGAAFAGTPADAE